MSILVTGGAGYIGSHMTWALLDRGERVVVIDNLSTGFRWAVADEAELIVGDICNKALVADIIQAYEVETIVHFAGSIVVPDSVKEPLKYYYNNTVKSHALIETAVKEGVRNIIFSSTAAVYGVPDRNPVFEQAPLKPISPYGASKTMTEQMLKDTSLAHDLNYVALRYFNVAGADPMGRSGQSMPRATHLIKVAAQTALGLREKLAVFGTDYPTKDGTCIRDYIHVSDLAEAHVHALEYLRNGGQSLALNCGYGAGYSVLEVIDAVKRIAKTDFAVEFAERRAGDPADLVAGADLVRKELGWQPRYNDLDTIVEHAYAWEKRLGEKSGQTWIDKLLCSSPPVRARLRMHETKERITVMERHS